MTIEETKSYTRVVSDLTDKIMGLEQRENEVREIVISKDIRLFKKVQRLNKLLKKLP